MMYFLRRESGHNVYEFDCPYCGMRGEVGIPVDSQTAFDHGCGSRVLYIQRPAAGMFTHPRCEEVFLQGGAHA
jgi:DNA-directed RNA polymerase subunit RPC12/RpoP